MIKLFEIVILWVYYIIPFGFSLFWHFWDISFQLLKLLLWLRTTDEGSVPEMRIWSILFIKSDLKWCIHLGRSLFLYFTLFIFLNTYYLGQIYPPELEIIDTTGSNTSASYLDFLLSIGRLYEKRDDFNSILQPSSF